MLVLTRFGGVQSLALRWTEMCENVTLEYNYLCSSEWECMYDLATKVDLGEAERLQMSAGAADGWSNGFRQQLLQILTNEWPGLLDNLEKQTGRERMCHIWCQNVSGFFLLNFRLLIHCSWNVFFRNISAGSSFNIFKCYYLFQNV